MSHVITEVATFTPTVTVPDGVDTMVAAAETVAAIAQALANRTRALKAVTDVAARTNVTNDFTAAQIFSGGVLGGLIATLTVTGGTGIQASSGNVRANTGDVIALLGNIQASAGNVLALLGVVRGKTVESLDNMTVGSDGTGNLTVNGTVTAAGNLVVGTIPVPAAITATGFFCRVSSDYQYSGTAPTRKPVKSAIYAKTDGNASWDPTSKVIIFSAAGTGLAAIPLHVPHGSTLSALRVMCRQFNAAVPLAFTLRKRITDWAGVATSDVPIGSVGQVMGGAGVTAIFTHVFTPFVADNYNETYYLLAECAASGGDSFVYGIEQSFLDPGPRGY
jgi:hypothetical protein